MPENDQTPDDDQLYVEAPPIKEGDESESPEVVPGEDE